MFERIRRYAQALKQEAGNLVAYVKAGGTQNKRLFEPAERTTENLNKWQQIYDQGGIVAEAIDQYPLFVLSKGYRLEGDEVEKQRVQTVLDRINFEDVIWQGILDAAVLGDGFQENVATRTGNFHSVVPRDGTTFKIEYDDKGLIQGFTQTVMINGGKRTVSLTPDQIVHITLFKTGGRIYGNSLIKRAYDDIRRDIDIIDGGAHAIKRHGFPKYHVKVGREGERVADAAIDGVRKELEDLNSKNEIVTQRDVDMANLDAGGITGLDVFNQVSIQRVCTAIGVPEEVLGLGRGSTEATANVRLQAWYDKIATIQKQVARIYTREVIDRITGKPGAVKLVFNDVNPQTEASKAAWIAPIMQATPLDPYRTFPLLWIQEQFKIDPKKYAAPALPAAKPLQPPFKPFEGAGAQQQDKTPAEPQ